MRSSNHPTLAPSSSPLSRFSFTRPLSPVLTPWREARDHGTRQRKACFRPLHKKHTAGAVPSLRRRPVETVAWAKSRPALAGLPKRNEICLRSRARRRVAVPSISVTMHQRDLISGVSSSWPLFHHRPASEACLPPSPVIRPPAPACFVRPHDRRCSAHAPRGLTPLAHHGACPPALVSFSFFRGGTAESQNEICAMTRSRHREVPRGAAWSVVANVGGPSRPATTDDCHFATRGTKQSFSARVRNLHRHQAKGTDTSPCLSGPMRARSEFGWRALSTDDALQPPPTCRDLGTPGHLSSAFVAVHQRVLAHARPTPAPGRSSPVCVP